MSIRLITINDITDPVRVNNLGKVLSDTTYSAPWQNGVSVFSDGDGNMAFSLGDHGFTTGDTIEVKAGNTSLPDGLEAYDYRPSGYYYNVIVEDTDIFYLTDDVERTSKVQWDGGAVGRTISVRQAMTSSSISLPDFTGFNSIKIMLLIQYGFRTTNPMSMFMGMNGDGANFIFGAGWKSWILPDANRFAKHSTVLCELDFTKTNTAALNEFIYNLACNRVDTTDFNYYTVNKRSENGLMLTVNKPQTLYIGSNNATDLQFRSIRAIIIQK